MNKTIYFLILTTFLIGVQGYAQVTYWGPNLDREKLIQAETRTSDKVEIYQGLTDDGKPCELELKEEVVNSTLNVTATFRKKGKTIFSRIVEFRKTLDEVYEDFVEKYRSQADSDYEKEENSKLVKKNINSRFGGNIIGEEGVILELNSDDELILAQYYKYKDSFFSSDKEINCHID